MAKLIYGYLCRQPPLMKQSMTTLLFIWVFWYLNCGLWLNLFMQGEKKVVDRFLTFLILTRYRKICCNTNRRKTFETYKAARRGPAFAVLDCKSIYIVLLFCWKFFPNSARPHSLYFEVTWHLTIKLFPAKIIAKSMTTEGNSALLPATRELKQKRRRRLRKRHLKRWIRAASNFATLIPRSIRTNVVIFFWSWILKDSFEVQDRKRKSLPSFTSSTKRKIDPMYF